MLLNEVDLLIPSNFEKKTDRLIIRFYNEDDFELWKKTHKQLPKARNKWDVKPDPNFKGTRQAFKKMLQQEQRNRDAERYYFIALDRTSGQPIGHAVLFDIRRKIFQSGGLGYGIYNHSWGQGYGRELVEAMLEVAFKTLKLHRIEAAIEGKNRRSINLAKSVGMTREGIRRGFVYMNGEWKSLTIFSLLAEDFNVSFKFPPKAPEPAGKSGKR
ncbi:MAG: GNAT family N-acetyltransferase [Pseudobdellovibrionaceae bacterium]|nr:GNAT family N-acetyltransferase [Pseudobdellovibrionaceae bacterium]